MLTIGGLAAYVGVTVRAVRHYHQRGLLAEPERDASGYRRYGAQAVVDLIRIKTLADSGVPLGRVGELLAAEPARFAEAVTEIDEALAARIRDLQRQRERIAELVAGERLFLPDEVVEYLEALRDLGISARTVTMERDGWILVAARFPEQVRRWATEKRKAIADPDFRRLYVRCDQAFDWEAADPRLDGLADDIVAYQRRWERGHGRSTWSVDDPVTAALATSPSGGHSPAWARLNLLCEEKMSR